MAQQSVLAFEEVAGESGLTNDATEGSRLKFLVIGHRDASRRVGRAFLHHYVTTSPTNFLEPFRLQDLADVAAGQDAKLTQP